MRGSVTNRPYVSARGVARVRERLSQRDLAIIGQVAELRLMSARQIQAIHFPDAEHENGAAAMRARQRVLKRLCRERLLVALERRIGASGPDRPDWCWRWGQSGSECWRRMGHGGARMNQPGALSITHWPRRRSS